MSFPPARTLPAIAALWPASHAPGFCARPITHRVTGAGAKDAGQWLAASGWSELGEGGVQFADRFCARKDFSQSKRQDKSNIGLKEEPIYLHQCSRDMIIPDAWCCDAMSSAVCKPTESR